MTRDDFRPKDDRRPVLVNGGAGFVGCHTAAHRARALEEPLREAEAVSAARQLAGVS